MAREPIETDKLFLPADAEYRPLPAEVRLSQPRFFPPPNVTTHEGLLCIGGRLAPEWLLDAYSHAIFPWPMWEDEPIAWWSPDPRAIIELDSLHVSRRLRRTIKSGKFTVTCNRDFEAVIRGCATSSGREEGTWLTPAMIQAYCRLHKLGHAHSVEVWSPALPSQSSESELMLAGGTYGIAIGGLFAAESMFHVIRDASKVALAFLVAHLRARHYELLDIQQLTPHTASLGAVEISRVEYIRRLVQATDVPAIFGDQLCGAPLAEA